MGGYASDAGDALGKSVIRLAADPVGVVENAFSGDPAADSPKPQQAVKTPDKDVQDRHDGLTPKQQQAGRPPKPLSAWETAKYISKDAWKTLAYDVPAAAAAALEGGDPTAEHDYKDWLRERADKQHTGPDRPTAIPGFSTHSIDNLGKSIAFSTIVQAGGGLAALGAGLAASETGPGAIIAAAGAHGTVSAWLAYRAEENNFVNQLHDVVNQQRAKNNEPPISDAEFQAKTHKVLPAIRKDAAAQAGFEALGTGASHLIFSAPVRGAIGKVFGQGVVKRVLGKAAAGTGVELGTEAETQNVQHNAAIEAGIAKGKKRSLLSPSDTWQSIKEVAPAVIAQTGITAAATHGATTAHKRITQHADQGITQFVNGQKVDKKQASAAYREGYIDIDDNGRPSLTEKGKERVDKLKKNPPRNLAKRGYISDDDETPESEFHDAMATADEHGADLAQQRGDTQAANDLRGRAEISRAHANAAREGKKQRLHTRQTFAPGETVSVDGLDGQWTVEQGNDRDTLYWLTNDRGERRQVGRDLMTVISGQADVDPATQGAKNLSANREADDALARFHAGQAIKPKERRAMRIAGLAHLKDGKLAITPAGHDRLNQIGDAKADAAVEKSMRGQTLTNADKQSLVDAGLATRNEDGAIDKTRAMQQRAEVLLDRQQQGDAPWQQTRAAFYANPGNAGVDHEEQVAQALDQGQPVPPQVTQESANAGGEDSQRQAPQERAEGDGQAPEEITREGVAKTASVPTMITQAMRRRLQVAGYSDDAIRQMTPAQAWENLVGQPSATNSPSNDRPENADADRAQAPEAVVGDTAGRDAGESDLAGRPTGESRPQVAHQVADRAVYEQPVSDLRLSADVPQFKGGADESTGVVESLGGTFDRTGVAPIQVWERHNGDREVISGRHRLDLARRSGETTIPAQLHREADGFDPSAAARLDAELNIRDEQGSVNDYATHFRNAGITQEEAQQRGLLARAKGKAGFAIARNASDELFSAHRAGQVSDAAAERIANAAPNDERLQSVGLDAVNKGHTIADATNTMRAVSALAGQSSEQGDIFGFDDSAMRDARAMAKIASGKQRAIREQIAAVRGAAKRPDKARALGVDVKDPAAVNAKIKDLQAEAERWANWNTDPALVDDIRATLQGDPAQGQTTSSDAASSQGILDSSEPNSAPTDATQTLDAADRPENVNLSEPTRATEHGVALFSRPDTGAFSHDPRAFSTDADDSRLDTLRSALRRAHGRDVAISAVTPKGVGKTAQQARRLASFVHKTFGRNIVWFRADDPAAPAGVSLGDTADRIFVNVDTPMPLRQIVGHELTHELESADPQGYAEMAQAIHRMAQGKSDYAKRLRDIYRRDGLPDPDNIDDEFVADAVGALFTEPGFMRELAAGMTPNRFTALVNRVLAFLDKLRARIKGAKANPWAKQHLTDAKAARRAVVDALAYIKRRQGVIPTQHLGAVHPLVRRQARFSKGDQAGDRQAVEETARFAKTDESAQPRRNWTKRSASTRRSRKTTSRRCAPIVKTDSRCPHPMGSRRRLMSGSGYR